MPADVSRIIFQRILESRNDPDQPIRVRFGQPGQGCRGSSPNAPVFIFEHSEEFLKAPRIVDDGPDNIARAKVGERDGAFFPVADDTSVDSWFRHNSVRLEAGSPF